MLKTLNMRFHLTAHHIFLIFNFFSSPHIYFALLNNTQSMQFFIRFFFELLFIFILIVVYYLRPAHGQLLLKCFPSFDFDTGTMN